jgi:hypothetical protein
MIAKAAIAISVALAGVAPAAADNCRKVTLDAGHRSAPIGATPAVKNFGGGEVYISLATLPIEDLSTDPRDLVRVTGFVLGPGEPVGGASTQVIVSVDGATYNVQLAKHDAPATVEICGLP